MAHSVQSKKTGETYFLHSKEVTLKGGRKQVIFWFARKAGEFALDEMPAGYVVVESKRTGLPILKKK